MKIPYSLVSCFFYAAILLTGLSCSSPAQQEESESSTPGPTLSEYFDYENEQEEYTGGIRMIPIQTPRGEFKVWTKRVGNNPKMKVLLLHGGPGATHELYECFDAYLPKEGIEYIYYDQLGSYYSDQPSDTSLWKTERFVEEVEQVRKALGLNKDNFYLLGQSWGGILAMEYALKYQDNLKGLVISNMMASIPEYNTYAHEVLAPQLPADVRAEIEAIEADEDFSNPRYMELLNKHHYTAHVLRSPLDKWPESVNRCFKHLNPEVYIHMQGYSEFGITGDATLKDWDRKADLSRITVPTLVVGSEYDTMDPEHMEWMANEVPNGRYLYCPEGSHLSQYDDQKTYFSGLIDFVKDVDAGEFGE
ncbi:proline iminopeptidase-family hydrolase [Roseivirga sp. BDSF3-8]|uniref:proline iminopeptidase-family hydrolase n=1 Tax=Roseivirga sp. BDSF3-8 TaxID=3241598 RepID=UPI003531E5B3